MEYHTKWCDILKFNSIAIYDKFGVLKWAWGGAKYYMHPH